MSFITKIGENSNSSQKLAMMRKKYFRNISDFNQVWQQEKKQEQIKQKQQSHRKFNTIVNRELQSLQAQKQYFWHKKVNNQEILKDDYEKQMTQRVIKCREQKQIDRQYARLQNLQSDKFMGRRVLDFMKIYDRKAVKNNIGHRRIKTEVQDANPEAMSHKQLMTKKLYLESLEKQSMTNPLKLQIGDRSKSKSKFRAQRQENDELQKMKQSLENLRQKVPLLPSLYKQKRAHPIRPRPGSRSSRTLITNNVIF